MGVGNATIFCQAFVGVQGRRWVLLINKRYANVDVLLPGAEGARMQIINEASGFGPASDITLASNQITLSAYAVAVVHMPSTESEP